MSATTQAPIVPQRPTRANDTPRIPPRPARRAVDRSLSPSRDRFAPSPLDSLLSKSPNRSSFHNGPSLLSADPVDRSGSVDLPSVGQEGMEYAAVSEELNASRSQASSSRSASPEHTRSVGVDLKLHAPKPSLPASSAKQRVATVTRTDSDKAASFGIGQPGDDSTKKKASTTSQELSSTEELEEDEHGIPEIGRQVPMYPNAGDVQAPTPAEIAALSESNAKNHRRKRSGHLPPGSYGLHGHGVIPSDRLEQAYYGKHPELVEKEHTPHHSDRAQDYSLPSADLNKIVRETASHGTGIATHDMNGTPSEQVGWQAIESSSRPASVAPKGKSNSFGSQSSASASVQKSANPEISFSAPVEDNEPNVIHVDDPNDNRKSVMFSDEETPDFEYDNEAPILAPDEVAKDPSQYDHHQPAVEPAFERRSSSIDGEESSSRPTSRPASIFRASHIPEESAIAEDKAEDDYEPLFKDEENKVTKTRSLSSKSFTGEDVPNRFPSRDVWEDAPSSAHYTAEVNTPDMPRDQNGEDEQGSVVRHVASADIPSRDGETPAQAFARHQEELAEKELQGVDAFAENRKPTKLTSWAQQQPHLTKDATPAAASSVSSVTSASSTSRRPAMGRFPSRDVWEDAPQSLQLQTIVSNPQGEDVQSPADAAKPEIPDRPVRKMTDPSEKTAAAPVVPNRPKPQVPARPARQNQLSVGEQGPAESSAPKAKPAVPARFGGKIAQLQANFMSDLNKKLKIGPQAPKKDEPAESAEDAAAPVEKTPLVDARKGRARGPQRRAPQTAAATATTSTSTSDPVSLGFSTTTTLFSIDPDEGVLSVSAADKLSPVAETRAESEAKPEAEEVTEEKGVEEEDAVAKTEPAAATTVDAETEAALEETTQAETTSSTA